MAMLVVIVVVMVVAVVTSENMHVAPRGEMIPRPLPAGLRCWSISPRKGPL